MVDEQPTILGHKHFGFKFKKILEVSQDGLRYKDKLYKWNDIDSLTRRDNALWYFMFYQWGVPYCQIYFKDRSHVTIRGRVLEKAGEKSKVNFFRGTTAAYEELMQLIESKIDL